MAASVGFPVHPKAVELVAPVMFILLYTKMYTMSAVVSVRVPKKTKDTLDKAGIDVAAKTREYLEELAWETRNKATVAELHMMVKSKVKPSRKGSAERFVRSDRDAHS